MRRILTALGVTAAMSGAASADDGFYGKYETPRYEVVRQVGDAEVRAYAPHILAVVAVEGDQSGALNRGFRVLAGYIFGGNDGGASVAMTAPVTQSSTNIAMTAPVGQSETGGVWTVTFMMPRDFTVATLPAPDNAAVRFVEVPAKSMIALEFSGRATTRALEARTAEIIQIAGDAGLDTTGTPVFMFYDDPFTLPFNRRNEVAFELR
ncbi:MAG: heme-binding protein [Octadecabacter sp.]|nr:heme-binding protein [Octadecabacter sp.]